MRTWLAVVMLVGAPASAIPCAARLDGRLPRADRIAGSEGVTKLRSGASFARIYRYHPDAETDLVAKIHLNERLARVEQNQMEFVSVRTRPGDGCAVVPSRRRGKVTWHPYVDGVQLRAYLADPSVSAADRREVHRRYRRFLIQTFKRMRSEFGDDLVIYRRGPSDRTWPAASVWWLCSNLRGRSRARYGVQNFTPHWKNVIVENGTRELWLIEPW